VSGLHLARKQTPSDIGIYYQCFLGRPGPWCRTPRIAIMS